MNFKMVDEGFIMDQVHEYEYIMAKIIGEGMKIRETLLENVLLEYFPSTWNDI